MSSPAARSGRLIPVSAERAASRTGRWRILQIIGVMAARSARGRNRSTAILSGLTEDDPPVNGRFAGLLEWFSHGAERCSPLTAGLRACSLRTQQRANA